MLYSFRTCYAYPIGRWLTVAARTRWSAALVRRPQGMLGRSITTRVAGAEAIAILLHWLLLCAPAAACAAAEECKRRIIGERMLREYRDWLECRNSAAFWSCGEQKCKLQNLEV